LDYEGTGEKSTSMAGSYNFRWDEKKRDTKTWASQSAPSKQEREIVRRQIIHSGKNEIIL